MSTETRDDTDETVDRQPEQSDGRYGQLELGTNEFVIYDRENHAAWIESSVTVSLEAYQ